MRHSKINLFFTNFTLLRQGGHEIPKGSALVSDVGSKTLGIRRVKKSRIFPDCLGLQLRGMKFFVAGGQET